eukprot:UN33127
MLWTLSKLQSSEKCHWTCEGVLSHIKRNKGIYGTCLVWLTLIILLVVFNDAILTPITDFLNDQAVEQDNIVHILLCLSCAFVVYGPHPIASVTIWATITGYYWKMWGLLLMFVGLALGGLWEYFYVRVLCTAHCRESCIEKYLSEQRIKFRAFERSLEDEPFKLGFLLQLSPLQSQLVLLLTFMLVDCSLGKFLLGSWAGCFISISPAVILAALAGNLTDALSPNTTDPGPLIGTLFGLMLVVVCFIFLVRYAKRA